MDAINSEKKSIADTISTKIKTIESFFVFYGDIIDGFGMCWKKIALIYDENYYLRESNVITLLTELKNEICDEYQLNSFTIQYLNLVRKLIEEVESLPIDLLKHKKGIFENQNVELAAHVIDQIQRSQTIILMDNKLRHLQNFKLIRNIDKSIVIVGANGAGKSSFSRNLKTIFGEKITVISAQKVFLYQNESNVDFSSKPINDFRAFQKNPKLWRTADHSTGSQLLNEFQNLFKTLIKFHIQSAVTHFNSETSNNPEQSLLQTTCLLWSRIVQHRNMTVDNNCKVIIESDAGQFYNVNELSDGEKAIFYYIGNIILAEKDSYIIIDEPENHLHANAMLRLWDDLEVKRSDCKFVYLTHNLQFATSRQETQKIWMKKFIAPSYWEMEVIPANATFPEELFIEILGCRNTVLFCEGAFNSIDYELFTILFEGYAVMPVGGHMNVCNYTRAFNELQALHGNKAIGIIDGDFHREEFINKWRELRVFCLECCEIENLLCDEMLLQKGAEQFFGEKDSVERSKNLLLKFLKDEIESQITIYTRDFVNNCLKEHMIKKINSVTEIKEEIEKLFEKINIKELSSLRRELLEKIIEENDYESAFKVYCNKGISSRISNSIDKDYCKKVIRLLQTNNQLRADFKAKYFSHVLE
ncbi:MAG: AAA family ATPase [Desulfovibrio desulfuricans]|nr:AAA family ATPase [Desulfovibrio desulfuricans]